MVFAYINMGVALANQGRVNEAIQAYQKAIQIRSNSLEAHYNLAITLLSQGKKDEAIDQFNLVLSIDPGNIRPRRFYPCYCQTRINKSKTTISEI